jgi:hypothetical protein
MQSIIIDNNGDAVLLNVYITLLLRNRYKWSGLFNIQSNHWKV